MSGRLEDRAQLRVVGGEGRAAFMARVRAAERACGQGRLQKVVLARAVTYGLPAGAAFDHARTVAALRAANPTAVVFAVGDGHGRLFAGATPEVLLRANGAELRTHALAGSCAGSPDAPGLRRQVAALLASDKDRREHALVVQRMVATLQPFCSSVVPGVVPETRTLPHLVHLDTPIRARLQPGQSWRQVVEALHPTPAICGEPRREALAWLRAHESLKRGGFAGHVGWIDGAGRGACAVAIRSVLLRGRLATVYAGAGIVAGSEAEAEWHETELKLRTATEALRWGVARDR